MNRKLILVFVLLVVLSLSVNIFADEGMFLLNQIPKNLKGLKIKPDEIFKPGGGGLSDAVIMLGGGTASFVSPKGLILTNHHVAYSAAQKNSTPEHNYIEEGFYAKNLKEELPAPGYEVFITLNFKDITDQVMSAVSEEMTAVERAEAVRKKVAEIEKKEENLEKGTEGHVVSMLDGSSYYLFRYLKIKDIRLVYAPPSSIGNYGGDIDNWMWPRHTGDFSFMRAYVGPNGIPAEYNEENVPYNSETYLPISSKGVKNGDFTFIMGYPGHTMRYRTSNSVDWNQNISYPFGIKMFQSIIGLLEEESKDNEELAIKLSSTIKGLNNALKNYQGMVEGLRKSNILAKKKIQEKKLTQFLEKNPELKKKYGDVLPSIKQLYKEHLEGYETDSYLQYITFVQTVSYATTIQKWSEEKEKPDAERDPRYMDYQIPRIKKRMEVSARDYDAPTDAQVFKMFLCKMAALPGDQHVDFLREIIGDMTGKKAESAISDFVDDLYSNTKLVNYEDRMRMFDMNAEELSALNDPFIEFAKKVNTELERLKKKNDYFNGKITKLRPEYYKALLEWKGGDMYPDANRTIRFTYGTVKGYFPRDGIYYKPITRLRGVIEKHTGEEPFNAPKKLINLYRKKDYGIYIDKVIKDVPVDFLATTDITGGNSGSPIMNGNGEIIGAAFDGDYESMT
ncbi:MAG: S46 family peptidase, partial [Candidatus Neomarinimicrobiota bacterium]